MPITVQFATNRRLNGSGLALSHYTDHSISPSDPAQVTYGTAFVNEVNLTADTVGGIFEFQHVQQGGFSPQAKGDLAEAGRNLLVFIHGFANTFENAITRAAFNRDWLAASGVPEADTSVVAFCWPSLGRVIIPPILPEAYRADQTMAELSGLPLMGFLSNLLPIIDQVRQQGRQVFLLAHSMGHLALQSALTNWFAHGNGDAGLFDAAFLAAGDERYDSFEFTPAARLSGLHRVTDHTSILFNNGDAVLGLSSAVNATRRLGQDGPHSRADAARFPADEYTMVDCTGFHDYAVDLASSHQYYRRSPAVRSLIAGAMA